MRLSFEHRLLTLLTVCSLSRLYPVDSAASAASYPPPHSGACSRYNQRSKHRHLMSTSLVAAGPGDEVASFYACGSLETSLCHVSRSLSVLRSAFRRL